LSRLFEAIWGLEVRVCENRDTFKEQKLRIEITD